MRNKFELEIDEKLSLEARLEVLRKYLEKVKSEVRATEFQLKLQQAKNPKQLDIEKAIKDEESKIHKGQE